MITPCNGCIQPDFIESWSDELLQTRNMCVAAFGVAVEVTATDSVVETGGDNEHTAQLNRVVGYNGVIDIVTTALDTALSEAKTIECSAISGAPMHACPRGARLKAAMPQLQEALVLAFKVDIADL